MPTVAPSSAEPQVAIDPMAILLALSPMLRDAADEIGIKAVENIRESISKPVEYTSGGLIRSQPGQPPRMEEGELHAGIDFQVVTGEYGLPELHVTAERRGTDGDADAARVLEDGGLNGEGHFVEPRPFMRPEAIAIESYAPGIVEANLSQRKQN